MKDIPDGSIDMVLADPPYGITACKWDTAIPLEPMWAQLKRITKKSGAILLFGAQPFTSVLVVSNLNMFRYEWVWEKSRPAGYLTAKKKPLNNHEVICVFYNKQPTYNPQMTKAKKVYSRGVIKRKRSDLYGGAKGIKDDYLHIDNGYRYPKKIIKIKSMEPGSNVHPTQKPVALMEYLIKTYTNEGETVLDFVMGSGTTGVACKNLNRNFICIELDAKYYRIAEERICNHERETTIKKEKKHAFQQSLFA
jgi:site-specific DNA-methyltransferase (adenine-specific)